MKKLNGYGESLFMIAVGIVMFIVAGNSTDYGPGNTKLIKGVLADYPKEGVHDKSEKYIGLRISGSNDMYEFSGCSYDNAILEKVRKLKPGDKITMYTVKKSSSITMPWNGITYRSYKICNAWSPDYGVITTFKDYNRCNEYQSHKVLPVLGGILVLIGFFGIIKKRNDNRKSQERIAASEKENEL